MGLTAVSSEKGAILSESGWKILCGMIGVRGRLGVGIDLFLNQLRGTWNIQYMRKAG